VVAGVNPNQIATQSLITRLSKLRPNDGPAELLRLGLLLAMQSPQGDISGLDEKPDEELDRQCQQIGLQFSAASDQHGAVATELDTLASTAPCDFSPEHLWILVRALQVQSQLLNLYLGPAECST
jgi:trans-aconitate methyltransferase